MLAGPLAPKDFALRCLIATIIVGAAVILWRAADVFVLIFGAAVMAVALRSLTRLVTRHTPLEDSWALCLVVIVLLCIVLGLGVLIGTHLADQLLLPLAMAGAGSFRTAPPTPHTTTNMEIIEIPARQNPQ